MKVHCKGQVIKTNKNSNCFFVLQEEVIGKAILSKRKFPLKNRFLLLDICKKHKWIQ